MNLLRRIRLQAGLGRASGPPMETGVVSRVQVATPLGELHDSIPSVQQFGVASVGPTGTDHVIVYPEGDRSRGIAIASNHQQFRPKGMAAGETQLYDNAGQAVYLKQGITVAITGKTSIVLAVGGVSLTISASGFQFSGGPVMSDQDVTAGGISLMHHVQLDGGGTGNSGPPAPGT